MEIDVNIRKNFLKENISLEQAEVSYLLRLTFVGLSVIQSNILKKIIVVSLQAADLDVFDNLKSFQAMMGR